jgi:hypothetical protein
MNIVARPKINKNELIHYFPFATNGVDVITNTETNSFGVLYQDSVANVNYNSVLLTVSNSPPSTGEMVLYIGSNYSSGLSAAAWGTDEQIVSATERADALKTELETISGISPNHFSVTPVSNNPLFTNKQIFNIVGLDAHLIAVDSSWDGTTVEIISPYMAIPTPTFNFHTSAYVDEYTMGGRIQFGPNYNVSLTPMVIFGQPRGSWHSVNCCLRAFGGSTGTWEFMAGDSAHDDPVGGAINVISDQLWHHVAVTAKAEGINSEIQTVTLDGCSSGNYTLSLSGYGSTGDCVSAPESWTTSGALANDLKAALNLILPYPMVSVTDNLSGVLTLTFDPRLGNLPLLSVLSDDTNGTVSTEDVSDGSAQTELNIYTDGFLDNSLVVNYFKKIIDDGTYDFYFGAMPTDDVQPINSLDAANDISIKDFRIFRKALNQEQIQKEWNIVFEPIIDTMPADDVTSLSTDDLTFIGSHATYNGWDLLQYKVLLDDSVIFQSETDLTLTELNDLAYTGWHLGYLAVGVHTVELHIKRRYGTELSWQTDSFTITISA